MAAPNSPSDYARGYDVETSNNGTSWATVARCTGTANPETGRLRPAIGAVRQGHPDGQQHHPVVVDRRVQPVRQRSGPDHDTRRPPRRPLRAPTAAPTTASLSSSANPASVGQAVTYTVKVVPVPNGGTVNFFDNGSPIAGCDKVARQHHDRRGHVRDHVLVQRAPRGARVLLGRCPFQGLRLGRLRRGRQPGLPAPGYWLATANGQVYGLGAAQSLGGVTTSATDQPRRGHSRHPDRQGLLGGDGQRQRGRLR